MDIALVGGFYALVALLAWRVRTSSLAVIALGATLLLTGALIAEATFAPRLGGLLALGLTLSVVGFGLASRFSASGSDANEDADADVNL